MAEYKISLEAARVNAGLTQGELAERLHVSRATIMNWESGKHRIGLPQLEMFCRECNVPTSLILLPNGLTFSQV